MKCSICRTGETRPGFADVTLSRGRSVIFVRNTPAEVCQNCGEYYLSSEVSLRVQEQAEAAATRGVEIEVVGYAA